MASVGYLIFLHSTILTHQQLQTVYLQVAHCRSHDRSHWHNPCFQVLFDSLSYFENRKYS